MNAARVVVSSRRVRPLVLDAKLWASQHEIKDAKTHTLSSYALTSMVMHYLQCGINPPILPCLHKVIIVFFFCI